MKSTIIGLLLLFFVLMLDNVASAQDMTVDGNLIMQDSTATLGNILKGDVPFIHNFGTDNTFIGKNAGNLPMPGNSNTAGSNNTAIGYGADVSVGNLFNATAIGAGSIVDASNKIRLGDAAVTVIEAQGDFHASGPGKGIILKSPSGAFCRRLGIDDTGALVTAVVACP